MKKILSALLSLLLVACAANVPAPVEDRRTTAGPKIESKAALPEKSADGKHYIVRPGDTLIAISLVHDVDYRELATWNNIQNMNTIQVGQQLRIIAPEGQAVATPLNVAPLPAAIALQSTPAAPTPAAPLTAAALQLPPVSIQLGNTKAPVPTVPTAPPMTISTPAPASTVPTANPAMAIQAAAVSAASAVAAAPLPTQANGDDRIDWAWPLKPVGKILTTFTEVNKGIDMAGTKGTPVLSAASGKVIYAKEGLRGYGKLVIVKHSNLWLSAYAHSDKILVEEGQDVRKGQPIAEMGASESDQVKLHFEIRKQGKPVDPIGYLPAN